SAHGADHDALAAYYDRETADARKKAELHRNSAAIYEKLKISKPAGMANTCKALVSIGRRSPSRQMTWRKPIALWPGRGTQPAENNSSRQRRLEHWRPLRVVPTVGTDLRGQPKRGIEQEREE